MVGARSLGSGTRAMSPSASFSHNVLPLLRATHHKKIREDVLAPPPRHSRWQIALMNLSNEHLALFATQRDGSRWLLHPASFETRTLVWLSEPVDVTVAWELVKPSEITMWGADDSVWLSLSDADTSI